MRIIVNPCAGHGRVSQHLAQLETHLKFRGVAFKLLRTERPGHAAELASELRRQGVEEVVVVGGDGTISEVAGALACSPLRMGIVAVGTGNDIARSLKLPINRPADALDVILAGGSRRIDLGKVGDRYFVSLLGIGFPALVADAANRMRRLKGPPAFFVALYKALYRMRAVETRIELDDECLELRCTSVMIQNTPYTGGGLLMAPAALLDDGFLDVVVVSDIGRLDLMFNFPRIYRGSHVRHRHFSIYRTRRLRLEADRAVSTTVDGEMGGATPVEVSVAQAALNVAVS